MYSQNGLYNALCSAMPCEICKTAFGSPSGSYRRVKILLCAVLESNVNSDTFMQLNPFGL